MKPDFKTAEQTEFSELFQKLEAAKWSRADALGIGPTATPARGGTSTGGNAGVQALYSGYFGKNDWLLELRSGLSGTDDRRRPYLLYGETVRPEE